MKYICEECEKVIDEEELETYKEPHGEVFNMWCYCGGEYVPAETCELCGEPCLKIYSGVCAECLNDCAELEEAIDYGEQNKKEILINGYLAREFTLEEIELILMREVREEKRLGLKLKYEEFCLEDKCDFAEFLKESRGVNK